MSLEQHVLLPLRALPTTSQWQAALNVLPVGITLDPTLELATHAGGFWPCEVAGMTTGCEIHVDDLAELLAAYPQLKQVGAGREAAVSFRWGGDLMECAVAMGLAAALVKGFEGVAYYPEDDLLYDLDGLLTEFRRCVG